MKKILIVAGDPSGDLIASQLVRSLKKLDPELMVTGLGGIHLEKVSDRYLGNIVRQNALGFAISPKKILYFRDVLNNTIVPELKNNPPDAVIPVDFYGFNSCVAKTAKKHGAKVFYYASPQFWASRPGRADRLRDFVDLFLCLFPFEIDFYQKRNLPAKFVGHPILDMLPIMPNDMPQRVESTIGLLPGSRPDEIARHLPIMIKASNIIIEQFPGTRFVVFAVPQVSRDYYHKIITSVQPSKALIEFVVDENYQWRSQLDAAMTASGMETLENALLGVPMVVMYQMNWITFLVAKSLVNISDVGMPNLLSGRRIVPEFIQTKATPENIAQPIINWIKNPSERKKLRSELLSLRQKFGESGASDRAARTILEKVA